MKKLLIATIALTAIGVAVRARVSNRTILRALKEAYEASEKAQIANLQVIDSLHD